MYSKKYSYFFLYALAKTLEYFLNTLKIAEEFIRSCLNYEIEFYLYLFVYFICNLFKVDHYNL